ncbi:hypothetical protein V8G54_027888, partial [Vigna mungo]
ITAKLTDRERDDMPTQYQLQIKVRKNSHTLPMQQGPPSTLSSCTSFCNLPFSSVRFSQLLFKNSHSTSISFIATHAFRYLDESLVSNTKPHRCGEPTRKLFEDCDAENHISVLKKLFEV